MEQDVLKKDAIVRLFGDKKGVTPSFLPLKVQKNSDPSCRKFYGFLEN
jgi:hypothetical protein